MPALALLLAACGGGPAGDWVGLEPFESTEGDTFTNEMTLFRDGSAEGKLYFVAPNTETAQQAPAIYELGFAADWEKEGSTVGFDVDCGPECAFVMDCELGDTLDCDATPDFYTDDATYLRWTPAG